MRPFGSLGIASMSFLVTLLTAGWVLGDFPDMMSRVPGDANVLMAMDVERILASPLATKEGWKEKQAADYAARPLTFPPQVTKVIRAGQVDLELHQSKWQVA